ncbi:ImuA family protein [Bradyrhizobium acaciae]|uniref:ImuA family protein n=1 Tax=Bradyrhizobium acaciae TaxID=2683706 RepID=UPI001E5F3E3D|nr:damage-inducible mutagenesis protein [Bradyrhizobium acaciae]MCC8978909.1 damage-inducible mutagenesis protein [Bradyrhizobium acaciae]
MALASPPIPIAELRRWLERAEAHACGEPTVLPFDVAGIDRHLPTGGLGRGQLHEVCEGGIASEYAGLATLFTAGILARIPGPVLWCLKGRDLFAPGLARVGLHPDRVIYCETWKDRDVLPAMEEGLRCHGLAGVVGELTKLPLTASRRLQLCAGQSGVTAFAIRRWYNSAEKALIGEPNAAATRWRVSPSPSPQDGFDGLQRQHWKVELLRVRGGDPHSWILEACDAQGRLAVPAALADRSVATQARRLVAAI